MSTQNKNISSSGMKSYIIGIELIVVVGLSLWIQRIVNDDVFITLRYARNLIHGIGFVYTHGEHIFGITNPFLALLEALFSLPFLGNVLLGDYLLQYVLLLGCVYLVYKYFEDILITAALIPFLFFNPQTIGYFGNEVILLLFLSLLAIHYLDTNRDKQFAFCLSFIYLARFDGFIFGIIATVLWYFRRRPFSFKKTVQHIAIWAILPIIWHLFAYYYYGKFFPNSVTSKLFGSEHIKDYITILWEKYLPAILMNNGNQFQEALILTGLIIYWRRIGIYFIWLVLFSLVYWVIRAPGVHIWYFYTLTFVAIFSLAGGIAFVARKLFNETRNAYLFTIILSLIFISTRPDYTWDNYHWEKQRYTLYRFVADQVTPLLQPNAVIEMNDVGIMGYYFNRPVLDDHFLVTAQGTGKMMFPSIDLLRESVKPQFIIVNPYKELQTDEISKMYPSYIYRTFATTPDKSIHVYIFERENS